MFAINKINTILNNVKKYHKYYKYFISIIKYSNINSIWYYGLSVAINNIFQH